MSFASSLKTRIGAIDTTNPKWWWIGGGVAAASIVGMALVAFGAKRPPKMVEAYTGDDGEFDDDDPRHWTMVREQRLPHLEENTGAGIYDNRDVTTRGSAASWDRDNGSRFFKEYERRMSHMADARQFGRAKTK